MQSSKEQILAHLKRMGASSVDGLATALGLARMTIRQHLAALERDGLVSSRAERQRTGRPHFLYSLSDRGQETFPRRYDRLADLLLDEITLLEADEIVGLSPAEKKQLLMKKMADRIYQEHQSRVQGKTLPERVETVTQILSEEGGLVEWKAEDRQFEIVDYNCIYRRVAGSHDDLCTFHLSLLSRLLGQDVRCDQFMNRGADCCRFLVQLDNSNPQAT